MRVRRVAWVFAAFLSLWLAAAPSVWAAVRIMVPSGWSESGVAAPDAQRRAERWREALGLRLAQVLASREDDRFAETAAVFERSEPVPAAAFATADDALAALTAAVAPVVGDAPPQRSELRSLEAEGQPQVAWAEWVLDELVYECVLAPSGESSSVIIIAVQARDVDLHRGTIDGMIAGLEGVTAPMPAFSLNSWRAGSVVVWLALALLLHAILLGFGDRERDHRQAGTRAVAILLGLVVLGTGLAAIVLSSREAALVYAGSSLSSLLVWIGVAGLVVAGVHFLLATRAESELIRSAPSSGVYASATSNEVIRSAITRTNMRLRPEDVAGGSGSWAKLHAQGRAPGVPGDIGAGASESAPIIIDDAEREP